MVETFCLLICLGRLEYIQDHILPQFKDVQASPVVSPHSLVNKRVFPVVNESASPIKSVALSLHYEIPELGLTYLRCLEYAKQIGASHVTLVVQASMKNIQSSEIRLSGEESTPISVVKKVLHLADKLKLKVILFPVLWIEQRGVDEWRGVIHPDNRDTWWSSYESWLNILVDIANEYDVDYLSIGSELSSMESDEGRWRALIRRINSMYRGKLFYSSNWDHFTEVPFWDQLDLIGLTAYFPLEVEYIDSQAQLQSVKAKGNRINIRVKNMIERWQYIKLSLLEWLGESKYKKKLFFTELGYPSQKGGATKPWDYLQNTEVDLEVQKAAFLAFRKVWVDFEGLAGVNIWNFWGLGGPQDTWYTVRGKPAAVEIEKLFKQFTKESALFSNIK